MSSKEKRYTVAGTDINEVKALLAAKYLNSKNERN